MRRSREGTSLLLVALLLAAPACFAERADRSKPLHLEADRVEIDDIRKISTFEGHVRLTQGTMDIQGQRVIVVQDAQGFERCTVYGPDARFRQKREGREEFVEGVGGRIEYDARAETVDFFDKARVRRNQDEVRGDHVAYNQQTELFQVLNDQAHGESRVRAVLQPRSAEPPPPAPALPISGTRSLPQQEVRR